jgi:predicted permease
VITLALAIAAAVAGGVGTHRRWPHAATHGVNRMLSGIVWLLLPPVVFINVAHFHLDSSAGVGLALAYVELAVIGALAWLLATRVLRLERDARGALICCTLVANTGYVGVPLTTVLFGSGQVAAASAWDGIVSMPIAFTAAFAVGAIYGKGAVGLRSRARMFASRNPMLWALFAGLVAPAWMAPHVLLAPARITYVVLLPLSCFALGVYLAGSAHALPAEHRSSPVATAVALRMVAAPALFAALAALTIAPPAAFYLQSAMPCGFNALLTAHMFGLDLRLTTRSVAWSTALMIAAALIVSLLR